MGFYLYRFVDIKGEIIYIGRTNNIKRRILEEHFTEKTHIVRQCYLEINQIEYTEISNESEEVAYEAVLINRMRPKYNIQFKDGGNFDIKIPEFQWKKFEWEYDRQLDWLKKKKMGVINIKEAILNYMNDMENRNVLTGFLDIDSRMILLQQSFTLVAGVSGAGKTDYLLNIATYNARRGKRVVFINLKNSLEDLTGRILSIYAQTTKDKVVKKQLTEKEWNKIIEGIEKNDVILFYNVNADYLELKNILSEVRDSNADLIIIDDIQMIEDEGNRYMNEKIDFVLKNIKSLGMQLSTPIIGGYCIPWKSTEKRPDHRPILSDLEYNALISYPDNIQLIYRDGNYEKSSKFHNIAEIIIAKNMLGNLFSTRIAYLEGRFASIKQN